MLASNQKTIDQHILLFNWSIEDKRKEVVLLDITNDKYKPIIDLQENGEDNLLLGLGVDKFSISEKVRIQIGTTFEELPSRYVLLCLTSEGKLIMYHAARISDPAQLPQTMVSISDDKDVAESHFKPISSECSSTSDGLKQIDIKALNPQKVAFDVQGETISSERSQEADRSHLRPLTKQTGNLNMLSEETPVMAGSALAMRTDAKPDVHTFSKFSVESSLASPVMAGSALAMRTDAKPDLHTYSKFSAESSSPLTSSFGSATAASMHANPKDVKWGEMGGVIGLSNTGAPFGSQPTGKLFAADVPNAQSSTFTSDIPVLINAQEKAKFNKSSSGFLSANQSFSSEVSNRQPLLSMHFSSQFPLSSRLTTEDAELRPTDGGFHTLAKGDPLQETLNSSPEQTLFDRIRASKFPRIVASEPDMLKQFYNVKDLVQELDILLSFIEKEKGFRDACTLFQKNSLLALENGLEALSETSCKCKKNIEEQLMEVQQLQNKMLQVSTRLGYMKGIVEQASNRIYWDIWNQQKLNFEFQAKWNNILNANQNLTNHIIELERHFNTIEINKFCESGKISSGRSQSGLKPSRQIQSLQSVYNTVNSQLATAEHLSKCLSEQMNELNISSAPVKQHSTKKELFELIGFSRDSTVLGSPYLERPSLTPDSVRRTPPPSRNAITKKNSSVAKTFEPETARRRRDSLHRDRTGFVPPKMTVKRIVQERSRVTADKPFRKAKEVFDSQLNEFDMQQKSVTTSQSSSPQNQLNKGMWESHPEHFSEAQSSSVFGLATISSQTLGSISHHMAGIQRTGLLPTSVSPSLSTFSSPQFSTKEVFGSSDISSIGSTRVGTKTVSSFKSVSNVQSEASSPLQTSRTVPSSISPMNSRPKPEVMDQASKDLNFKNEFMSSSVPKASTESRPSIANENNISSHSTPPYHPSVGFNRSTASFDKVTTKNQSSESIFNLNSDTKALPVSSSSSKTSVATTSLSLASPESISFGKSLVSTKPVGVPNQTASVSIVTSTSNPQSLPSFSILSSQSLGSETPASTPMKPTTTFGVPSVDAKSLGGLDQMGSVSMPQKSLSTSFSSFTTLHSGTGLSPSLPVTSATTLDSVSAKSQPTKTESAISEKAEYPVQNENNSNATKSGSMDHAACDSQPEIPSSSTLLINSETAKKDEALDVSLSQEDEMEEEAVDTTNVLSLGSLGGFGLGSAPPSSATKPNPFGGSLFLTNNSSTTGTQVTSLTASPGEPFRPASFTLPSASHPVQQTSQQPASSGGFSSGFGGGGMSGFGQPGHVGVGQQALGSVLGTFGQSRQPGVLPEVGLPSSTAFGGGGFSSSSNTGRFPAFGGFAAASTGGGGFTSVASASGGFAAAAAAAKGVGGFAAVSSGGSGGFAGATAGGFAAVAPSSGFASAAPGGVGGFGGAGAGASGGFGAFGSNQGGAFSAFGQNTAAGSGKPPAELLTQMRK